MAPALESALRHPTAEDVGRLLLVISAGRAKVVRMTSFEGMCVSDTSDEERWTWEAFEAQSCFVLPDVPGLNECRGEIVDSILVERERQSAKWGGAKHDDTHGAYDWIAFIAKHAGKAMDGDFRGQMIRVAALAIAAIETCDRQSEKATAALVKP